MTRALAGMTGWLALWHYSIPSIELDFEKQKKSETSDVSRSFSDDAIVKYVGDFEDDSSLFLDPTIGDVVDNSIEDKINPAMDSVEFSANSMDDVSLAVGNLTVNGGIWHERIAELLHTFMRNTRFDAIAKDVGDFKDDSSLFLDPTIGDETKRVFDNSIEDKINPAMDSVEFLANLTVHGGIWHERTAELLHKFMEYAYNSLSNDQKDLTATELIISTRRPSHASQR
ncbi:uncharacterized protein LOC117103849 [Anneissia japonica]|uniref:uncharacterized protein LOC117103849 n=1 Tax=Anneissia japonica TaxID=1529436 RepID=UPI001425A681|nr:uncharacterized protein LOC117103849 [Anneissia japonica]